MMKIFHILGDTHCIDTGMSYIPFYRLDDKNIVMLDSGWAEGERAEMNALLDREGLKVIGIINSHAHIDHTGNNRFFKEKDNAILSMSDLEASICESPMSMKSYFGGYSLEDVKDHYDDMMCHTDIRIQPDQTRVDICGVTFEIVHSPGHSPAHIAIMTPDRVLYVGDAMISYEVMKGAKMPYAFVMTEAFKSMQLLAETESKKYVVAHKGIYDDIHQLVEDNITFFKHRAKRVKETIVGSMTEEEILSAVIEQFNIRIKSIHYQLVIERMMKSFLDYLLTLGQVSIFIESGFIKYAVKE